MLRFILLAMLLPISAFAKTKALEELTLPDALRQQVEKDLPVTEFVVHNDQTVIFLGKNCLWRWNLNENALKKLCRNRLFVNKQAPFLSAFYILGSHILVASDKELIEFDPSNQNVIRYGVTLPEAETIQKIVGEGDFIWLVTNRNLYRIDRYGKQVKIEPVTLKSFSDQSLFLPDEMSRRLYVATPGANGFLLSFMKDGKWTYSKGETFENLISLGRIDRKIIVATKKSIQTLNDSFAKSKEISVQNQRSVIQARFSTSRHTFLFNDGLCESYDTASGKRVSLDFNDATTKISIQAVRAIDSMASYIVLLEEGLPRVFVY